MTPTDGGLRSLFRQYMKDIQWTTVETGATQGGVPDLEGCFEGHQFWIENKKTDAWALRFEALQISWHLHRARMGGQSYIAVRRRCSAGPRKEKADELWIYPGRNVLSLKVHGLKAANPWIYTTGGPSKWDWDAVRSLFKNPPLL